MKDRRIILAAALVRSFATGFVGVLLGLYLAASGLDAGTAGLVVAAGLAGAACATAVAALAADRLGRRGFLIGLTGLAGLGAVALVATREPWAMAAAAFAGMVNGMGRDRGAALVLEQAVLPATTDASGRTRTFAIYNLLQDLGHASGGLAAAVPGLIGARTGDVAAALHGGMLVYAGLAVLPLLVYLRLSTAVEIPPAGPGPVIGAESRRVLTRISALFLLDSLGGGFLTTSLLTFFFAGRFGASGTAIAVLFFAARLANAGSHLGAAWLARRIGLVNTMVFTHIPSSLLLVTVAWAPSFPVAAALFLLREGLVEMDVPTRQSYVMAMVRPEERTLASAVTGLVRMAGWAVAPAFAGLFMDRFALMVPLVIGAALKIAYDLLLYRGFRHLRPPEERGGAA